MSFIIHTKWCSCDSVDTPIRVNLSDHCKMISTIAANQTISDFLKCSCCKSENG